MLRYDELENLARLKRLSLINAEKDYLQDIILFSIYSQIGKELVFKGGTCLYKVYKLTRFSEDLDFTCSNKINIEKIYNQLIADLALLNIKGKIKEIEEYKNEINIRLIINGPLYKGSRETQCFIPLNISLREQISIEPKKVSLNPLYNEIPNFEIFAMHEKEILAEKVRAIFTRLKPRDIYDLLFLLRKNTFFDLKLVNEKLSVYNLKFDYKKFEERINSMNVLWQTDLKNLIYENLEEFASIKKEILLKINK